MSSWLQLPQRGSRSTTRRSPVAASCKPSHSTRGFEFEYATSFASSDEEATDSSENGHRSLCRSGSFICRSLWRGCSGSFLQRNPRFCVSTHTQAEAEEVRATSFDSSFLQRNPQAEAAEVLAASFDSSFEEATDSSPRSLWRGRSASEAAEVPASSFDSSDEEATDSSSTRSLWRGRGGSDEDSSSPRSLWRRGSICRSFLRGRRSLWRGRICSRAVDI